MTTRVSHTANVLLTVLFLPGQVVEEGLHALASLPFAELVAVEVDPQNGKARTRVQFREGTPQWAISAAHLMPEVVATSAGIAVIAWWALGGDIWLPATDLDWILLALFGTQWLAVAVPNSADRDHSAGGEER